MDKSKKLVALITNHDDDIYCFRKELIQELIIENYNVLIVCPYGEKMELIKNMGFLYENIKIDRRGTNPVTDIILLKEYYSLLKKYNPNVILTYTVKPNIYAGLSAYFLNIPYIVNVTGLGSIVKMNSIKQNLVRRLFAFVFKRADCVFYQNRENLKYAKEKHIMGKENVLIPGSGVNLERFMLQEYPNGGNGISGDVVVFNYIGRVLKDKGIDDYISAAEIIKKTYPNTEFNVIGFVEPTESGYIKKMEKLEKQGILFYRGNQKDIRPFIKRSHATIHPSTYGEGMSNVLLESASSGRVVITTYNPGCMETVDNGRTGFLYNGGNVSELVKTIETFLNLDNKTRMDMGRRGREKMEREFSRTIVINAYLRKISKICGNKKNRYE